MALSVVGDSGPRTADQILTNDPFMLGFGDKKFKVKRLAIGPAKAWRALVIEHDMELAKAFNQETLVEKVKAMNQKSPDMIVDLLVAFFEKQAGDKITREDIEAGNDEQLLAAYEQLLEVTFPNGLMQAGTPMLQAVLK